MFRRTLAALAVLIVFLCSTASSGPPSAQDGINQTDGNDKAAPSPELNYRALSSQLAAVAGDQSDPVLMLAAARLEDMSTTETTSREKTSEANGDDGNGGSKEESGSLYEMAENLAGTNELLLALIESSSVESPKGRRSGAASHVDRVLAHQTDNYTISFQGGRRAEIAVVGDGDTDLDLYVRDHNGNLICSDTDYTDRNYCSWYPAWSGSFQVAVENLGNVWNQYYLTTN